MYLEGGGGGGGDESYEVAAYFYARHVEMRYATLPFFFITGDEKMYDNITKSTISSLFGKNEI